MDLANPVAGEEGVAMGDHGKLVAEVERLRGEIKRLEDRFEAKLLYMRFSGVVAATVLFVLILWLPGR